MRSSKIEVFAHVRRTGDKLLKKMLNMREKGRNEAHKQTMSEMDNHCTRKN